MCETWGLRKYGNSRTKGFFGETRVKNGFYPMESFLNIFTYCIWRFFNRFEFIFVNSDAGLENVENKGPWPLRSWPFEYPRCQVRLPLFYFCLWNIGIFPNTNTTWQIFVWCRKICKKINEISLKITYLTYIFHTRHCPFIS